MSKFKLLLVGLMVFVLSACAQTYRAQEHIPYYTYETYPHVDVYINYDFQCMYCYYEAYYCFNCNTFHIRINNWCHYHYNWYYSWYRVHYHYPYTYYYNHYNGHHRYRDYTRYYVRDRYGYRVLGGKNYIGPRKKSLEPKKIQKRQLDKRYEKVYKRFKTERIKTYKRPKTEQRTKTNKQPKTERSKTTKKK